MLAEKAQEYSAVRSQPSSPALVESSGGNRSGSPGSPTTLAALHPRNSRLHQDSPSATSGDGSGGSPSPSGGALSGRKRQREGPTA